MRFKPPISFAFLLVFAMLLLPNVSALLITNTTFTTSVTDYTIFVDSMLLDNFTVTTTTIEFYNVTSIGSNLTNANSTFDARADFFGLAVGLAVFNLNTSTELFVSAVGATDFMALFSPREILQVRGAIPSNCSAATISILNLITIFLALAVAVSALLIVLNLKGDLIQKDNLKKMLLGFIIIIVGIVLTTVVSNLVLAAC